MSGPLEGNGKSWKEVRIEQRKLVATKPTFRPYNNYSYVSGPLEGNGKSLKEVRNEQRKLVAPKPTLRSYGTKVQNTRALKRMNAKRNLFTRRRKNRK